MRYHIEKIVARVTPRLAFLRALSGKYWGADRATLLHLYTSWIRPIIEYSSTAFSVASPKTLAVLDRLQAQALRIAVGSSKISSIVALHSILDIHTLGIRRLRTAAKLHSKYLRGDSRDACIAAWRTWRNTAPTPTSDLTSNIFNPLRHKSSNSPYCVILKAAATLHLLPEDLTPEPLLPPNPLQRYLQSTSHHSDDAISPFPRFGSATSRTPAQLTAARAYAAATTLSYEIDLPDTGLLIFTDGSAHPDYLGGGGLGVLAQRPSGSRAWTAASSLPRLSTSYGAELLAIQHALATLKRFCSQTPDHTSSVVILSDCQSAILSSRQPHASFDSRPDYWSARQEIHALKSHLRSSGIRVRFDWIPGHIGHPSNDFVDASAKAAASRSRRHISPELPALIPASVVHFFINTRTRHASNLLTLSSNRCKTLFRLTHDSLPHNNSTIYKSLSTPRFLQVAIDRFTVGDHFFNDRLHHLDPLISSTCTHCPARDSLQHRLLECPHYALPRSRHVNFVKSIPALHFSPISLRLILGQTSIPAIDRTALLNSLCSYLKATDLVKLPRLPSNPPPSS